MACDGEFSGGDYCDSTGIGRGQKRLQSPVPQNKEPLEGPFWKAASTPGVTTPTPSYDDTVPGEIQVYKGILGLLDTASTYEDFINEAKPIYKRIKYAFPTGPFEAAVDAGLYGLTDKWSTSLTPGQRIGRMFIVGTESLIIDQISGIVGQAGNLIGGPLGGIAVNYLSSAILTDRVMPTVTWNLFDWLNLGAPAFFPRQ